MAERTNNNLQNITQKTKEQVTRTRLKTVVKSALGSLYEEGYAKY